MAGIPKSLLGVSCIAAGFLFLAVAAHAREKADPLPPPPTDTTGLTNIVRRGIIVRKAPIQGRVFIAAEGRNEDELPAENVKVEVREKDGDKILEKAETDEQGYFKLSERNPDEYLLMVGGLTIRLFVEPDLPDPGELPKIVFFVLPRKMARSLPQ
jgi:hypothetical protein